MTRHAHTLELELDTSPKHYPLNSTESDILDLKVFNSHLVPLRVFKHL